MFFGHLSQIDKKHYPIAINIALDYLANTDFDALEVGRYPIVGDRIYAQVLDLDTQEKTTIRPEVHRRYIDVQYLHSGTERIGVMPDLGQYSIAQDYDNERDILFYQDVENEVELIMRPGNFAVFFPQDIHRPACLDQQSTKIRKVVVKIAVNELEVA
ncbi:YhcH/YjgK/YiaL family protein [Pasteurella canis]|uniref:YhcH/YjgK/YiaL family protein n=1 Tax=Pasteurella canis TaxID=753 RepID=UPI001CC44A84|nr:YhcH/YjgK/YiaL family protein [Pasteurella canis]UAY77542.1 YhcH/YjgK/YiaL family protein [Pasteurella canis]